MAAISVDRTAESERLRTQLSLPFAVLCDMEGYVIREWDLLNARERGGIAKPSVFVLDPGRRVRYAAVGTVMSRVSASEVLSILQADPGATPIRRKTYLPLPGDWIRAIRNTFRKA